MSIFEAIAEFLQGIWKGAIELARPLVSPDWGWLVSTVLPLAFGGSTVLYLVYLAYRYRSAGAANADRMPPRLTHRPGGGHVPAGSWWPVLLSIGAFFSIAGIVLGLPLLLLGLAVAGLGTVGWFATAMGEWGRASGEVAAGGPGAVGPWMRAASKEPPPGMHAPGPSWWPVYAAASGFLVLLGLVVSLPLLVAGVLVGMLAVAGWFVDANREYRTVEAGAHAPARRDPLAIFPRLIALAAVVVVATGIGLGLLPAAAPSAGPGGSPAPGGGPAATPAFTPGTADDPRVVTLEANAQLRFVPDTVEVKKGETIRFEITNTAGFPHNFWIGPQAEVEKKNTAALKGTPDFSEGTQALEVTFEGDGPYAFGCFIPGHYEAGMKGTIALTP